MSGCNFHARDIDRIRLRPNYIPSKKARYEINKVIRTDYSDEIRFQRLTNNKTMRLRN